MVMWWHRKRRENQRLEEIRQERGKLAMAVSQLSQKRNNVEQLMRDMLEERRKTAEET